MQNRLSNDLKLILSEKIDEYHKKVGEKSCKTKIFIYCVLKEKSKSLEEIFLYLNINIEELAHEVINIKEIPSEKQKSSSNVFNQNLITSADRESKSLKHPYVGPEHIVLACIRYKGENKTIISIKTIFQKHGIKAKDFIDAMLYFSSPEKNEEGKTKDTPITKTKARELLEDGKIDDRAKLQKLEENLISLGHIRDLSAEIMKDNDCFIGREAEIERASVILSRKNKKNIMILGEAGIGKTALVRGIAKKNINKNKFYQIHIENLVAGTKYRGDFEKKIKDVIDFICLKNEIEENLSVIFIDEFHTMVGAGAAEGSIDAVGILKPRLSSGEVQCIATTTSEEYRKYIMKDSALCRRFSNMILTEPDLLQTKKIMEEIAKDFESFYDLEIDEKTIDKVIKLSHRYVKNRSFPDKSIDALDEICARVINKKENEIQDDVILEAFTDITKIPLKFISGEEKNRLCKLKEELNDTIIGQEEAIDKIITSIYNAKSGLNDPDKPLAVFLFLGSTGVGKTFMSKELSKRVFGTDKIIRLDMSEYMDKINISKIIGAAPGYIGYDEAGQLTEAVRNNPYSLILLDEIEKAHPTVFNLFLQLFDEGRLTDSYGRTVDFRNTIIIMTSNIGTSNFVAKKNIGFIDQKSKGEDDASFDKEAKKFFSPEFFNRIDETIFFKKIEKSSMDEILYKEVLSVKKRLREKGYKILLSNSFKEYLIEIGFDEKYGARPIKRAVNKYIVNNVSRMIIEGGLVENDTVYFTVDHRTKNVVVEKLIKKEETDEQS